MERDIANPGISLPLAKTRCGTSLAEIRGRYVTQSVEHYYATMHYSCTPELLTGVKRVCEFS